MAARWPLERGRCAEPDMVPADPGGALGAELWAVKEGPCHSTWRFHTPNAAIGCHMPHRDTPDLAPQIASKSVRIMLDTDCTLRSGA